MFKIILLFFTKWIFLKEIMITLSMVTSSRTTNSIDELSNLACRGAVLFHPSPPPLSYFTFFFEWGVTFANIFSCRTSFGEFLWKLTSLVFLVFIPFQSFIDFRVITYFKYIFMFFENLKIWIVVTMLDETTLLLELSLNLGI